MNDTICAIATSQGVGAISIIRVSGEEAVDIVAKIFIKTGFKAPQLPLNQRKYEEYA